MAEENKVVNDADAAIISIVAVMMIGEKTSKLNNKDVSKIDLLEHHIKETKYLDKVINGKKIFKPLMTPQVKHLIKLLRYGYANWKSLVFRQEEKHSSLKQVRLICEKIAKESVSDFTALKNAISHFMQENDNDFNEACAYQSTIMSLLHLAIGYCEKAKEQFREYNPKWQSLKAIQPFNLWHNGLQIYPLVFYPEDTDINDSKEVWKATDEMVERIFFKYVANFYKPKQDDPCKQKNDI